MTTLPQDGLGVNAHGVMRTTSDMYRWVNDQWSLSKLPALDGPEAISAAKRLWRVATGKPWKGKWQLTSGNRQTWPNHVKYGVFMVNPDKGWHGLVHSISHAAHRRVNNGRPHDGDHARLEAKLIKYVVDHHWLDGALKAKPKVKPTLLDKRQARLARVLELRKGWESKAKRADTALRKLRDEERRLRRALAPVVVEVQ